MKSVLTRWPLAVAWAMGVLACVAYLLFAGPASAADLGGNCCADLEERIAELEATTAHKGNRKLTLTIDGQLSNSWQYLSTDGYDNSIIGNNGNDESYVGFSGAGRITPQLTAGYRLEIDVRQLGLLGAPVGGPKPEVRQSYWWVRYEDVGQVSVGRQGTATNDFDKWSTNKAWMAGRPLSFGSLSDAYLTGFDPIDGTYRDVIRYDSPLFVKAFSISASWGPSVESFGFKNDGDFYDVALRYMGEPVKDLKVTGAVGYRHDTDLHLNLLGITTIILPTGDVDTFLVNGSVLNVPTGVFLNASYADQDWKSLSFKVKGLEVTGGWEGHLNSLGKTDLFGTWGQYKIESIDQRFYGLGAVQSVDAVATDFFVGWRRYQEGDVLSADVDVINAGATVHF